ncbi:MAG TPA: GNAT family N-acetyltransferase [Actinocrinis sp.]|jgi:ribosomal protein S18 acetylase RimI-like enzyme
MRIRHGGPTDFDAVLTLGDEAVAWMNARGNTTQWGTGPWTGNDRRMQVVRGYMNNGGVRIAETDEGRDDGASAVVGVLVASQQRATYAPHPGEPELYVNLLMTSRRHGHRGIGAALIDEAKAMAAELGVDLIRVDCWSGEEGNLVRVYEGYGFKQVDQFLVGVWPGTLLAMRLSEQ